MVAVPLAFAAGVKVRVPEESMAGATLNSDGLLLVTVKATVWLDSFEGPEAILVKKAFFE